MADLYIMHRGEWEAVICLARSVARPSVDDKAAANFRSRQLSVCYLLRPDPGVPPTFSPPRLALVRKCEDAPLLLEPHPSFAIGSSDARIEKAPPGNGPLHQGLPAVVTHTRAVDAVESRSMTT